MSRDWTPSCHHSQIIRQKCKDFLAVSQIHSLTLLSSGSFRENVEVQAIQRNEEGEGVGPGQTHWGRGSVLSSGKQAIKRCLGSPSSRMLGGLSKREGVTDGVCRFHLRIWLLLQGAQGAVLVGDQEPEKSMMTSLQLHFEYLEQAFAPSEEQQKVAWPASQSAPRSSSIANQKCPEHGAMLPAQETPHLTPRICTNTSSINTKGPGKGDEALRSMIPSPIYYPLSAPKISTGV